MANYLEAGQVARGIRNIDFYASVVYSESRGPAASFQTVSWTGLIALNIINERVGWWIPVAAVAGVSLRGGDRGTKATTRGCTLASCVEDQTPIELQFSDRRVAAVNGVGTELWVLGRQLQRRPNDECDDREDGEN